MSFANRDGAIRETDRWPLAVERTWRELHRPLENGFDAAAVFSVNLTRRQSDVALGNVALGTGQAAQVIHNLLGGGFFFRAVELWREIGPDDVTYAVSSSPFRNAGNQCWARLTN